MNDMLDHEIIAALGGILDEAPAAPSRPPLVAPIPPDSPSVRPDDADELPVPVEPNVRSTRALRLVAASVAALLLSGIALVQRRNSPDGPSTAASTPTATSAVPPADAADGSSGTTATSAATSSMAQRLSAYAGWYLPTALPDGYEIVRISAAPVKASPEDVEQRWLRTGADGQPAGALSLMTFPIAPADASKPPRFNASVHGIDAFVFDSGEGIVVSWQEAGRQVMVRGVGMPQDDTLAAAQTVVAGDAPGRFVMNPGNGFSLVPTPPTIDNGVSLGVDLLPADGRTEATISFSASPNTDGETLQTIKQRVDLQPGVTSGIEPVAGIDRLVVPRPGGVAQTALEIAWIQDGFVLSVIGGAPLDQLVAVAASVQAVAPERLVTEGERITERLLDRGALDTATFADGTTVTLRTVGDRVAGLCVEAPVVECRWILGDAQLSPSRPTAAFAAFGVNGRTLLLGWRNGPEQPGLEQTGSARAPQGTMSTASITETKATDQGQFVEIVVPVGEQPPPVFYGGQGGAVIITESEQLLLR